EHGLYFDPAKLHVLNHKGKYLTVRGPLNIARPIQGWPVMVQAGASDAGRQLAAETAEMVFAAGGPIEAGRAFYADVKGRAAKIGRNPDHIKILPGAFTIIGSSLEEAQEKRLKLDSLVSWDSGIAALSIATGVDARKVVPELQRRGIFRTEYEGKTLRENLGLPRPENRFFTTAAKAAE